MSSPQLPPLPVSPSSAPQGDGASVFPDLKVAAVQMEPRIGQVADNVARSVRFIEQAAAQGASVVVLPELANTGYVFSSRDEAFALGESATEGPTTRAWQAVAARLGLHLVAGLTERDGDRLYNTAVVMGPRGLIGRYRKLHLWGDEHLFFEPGNLGLPVFHTEVGRLSAVICYDGWFPEVYRLLAMQGADLVCMPTNWVPMPQQPAHMPAMANTLAMAAAHSNGMAVVCANRVGTERGQPFIGQSLIVGAQGWPLAGPAAAEGEAVLVASVNLKHSRSARQLNAFNHVLRDRRTDLYDPMLGTGWPRPAL
ncbi:nitrilase family protein [Roseateles sp. SL47]|uniref:nitrilase family protein n=1 Tax=Roseateles sp. SL47 TaxID=2995138 RepID=UPI00226D94C0|nr:nitrilase family protein [Roseateles sp. SL47]WAC74605.1 nitrilase family protein [Roseateles sp. SL47]